MQVRGHGHRAGSNNNNSALEWVIGILPQEEKQNKTKRKKTGAETTLQDNHSPTYL